MLLIYITNISIMCLLKLTKILDRYLKIVEYVE